MMTTAMSRKKTSLSSGAIPRMVVLAAIITGHHTPAQGKLGIIDVGRGRQEGRGIDLLAPERDADPGEPDIERRTGKGGGDVDFLFQQYRGLAADDIAVERFLAGTLSYPGMTRLVATAVDRFSVAHEPALDELEAIDAEVRAWARSAPEDALA